MILSLLATVVDAECACAERCDLKQAAGHHPILYDVECLVWIGEIRVKEHRRCDATLAAARFVACNHQDAAANPKEPTMMNTKIRDCLLNRET